MPVKPLASCPLAAFLRVPNFEEFDHYKSRPNLRRTWIKFYLSILEEYRFASLPEKTRFVVVGMLCLAAETDNRIPNDVTWIKERLHLRQKPDLEQLVELGFLEIYLDESEKESRQNLDLEEEQKKKRRRTDATTFQMSRGSRVESENGDPLKRLRLVAVGALRDDELNPDLTEEQRARLCREVEEARKGPEIFELYKRETGQELT